MLNSNSKIILGLPFAELFCESVVHLIYEFVPLRLLTRLVSIVDRFRCHERFYRRALEPWGFVRRSGEEDLVHRCEDRTMWQGNLVGRNPSRHVIRISSV